VLDDFDAGACRHQPADAAAAPRGHRGPGSYAL